MLVRTVEDKQAEVILTGGVFVWITTRRNSGQSLCGSDSAQRLCQSRDKQTQASKSSPHATLSRAGHAEHANPYAWAGNGAKSTWQASPDHGCQISQYLPGVYSYQL